MLWRVGGRAAGSRPGPAPIACLGVTAVESFRRSSRRSPPFPRPSSSGSLGGRRGGSCSGPASALAFVTTVVVNGMPTDRVVLLGWVLTGLVAHAAVDGWRRILRLLAEWPRWPHCCWPTTTRGLADGLGMPVHVVELADADRWLGGGVLPTVRLQQTLEPTGGRPWRRSSTAAISWSRRRCPACCGPRTGSCGTLRPMVLALVGGRPGHVRALRRRCRGSRRRTA